MQLFPHALLVTFTPGEAMRQTYFKKNEIKFSRLTPLDLEPGQGVVAPSGPQLGKRPKRGGPNPFLVMGVALAAGIALAKLVDWRGHAHPRN